jgi:hypothetical protein
MLALFLLSGETMAEIFPNNLPAENSSSGGISAGSSSIPPGQPGALPELPETSVVANSGRASNAHLNRSAEAVGRTVGNAVAGVKSIPQQFDRLRSRIHLVDRYPEPEGYSTSLAEVAEDWRDAVEDSVSEMSEAANRYRVEFLDRACERLVAFRHYSERGYFTLRRDLNHRLEKVGRVSREEPKQFIAICAVAAFALGVAMRVRRSNHE